MNLGNNKFDINANYGYLNLALERSAFVSGLDGIDGFVNKELKSGFREVVNIFEYLINVLERVDRDNK